MSLQAYNAVWQSSSARGTDLLVLLALADFADESGWSHPSIDGLAKKARISQRAVQDRLRALSASNCIEIQLQSGPNGTNRYQIIGLPKRQGVQLLQGADSAGGVQIRDGKRDAKRDEDLHPNRKESLGIVRNRNKNPSSSDPEVGNQPAVSPSQPGPSQAPPDDIPSFEQFWSSYPRQPNGTKPEPKKARDAWLKLKPAERTQAFGSLTHYRRHLEQTGFQVAKHAFRYLRDRSFEGYGSVPMTPSGAAPDDPEHEVRRLIARA